MEILIMLKKNLFIFLNILLGVSSAFGMEHAQPMDIDQPEAVVNILNVPLLKEQCEQTIRTHKNKFTFQNIAQLPQDIYKPIIFNAALDVAGPMPIKAIKQLATQDGPVYATCVSHDNKLVVACADHTVHVFDQDGRPVGTFENMFIENYFLNSPAT